ncbi:MAG: ABC transporter substrate-binding protein, partial [Bifidobacterium mongoliense]|nr:ABC transporter substrate-binding protein [Bifidobacterium mongoliense]
MSRTAINNRTTNKVTISNSMTSRGSVFAGRLTRIAVASLAAVGLLATVSACGLGGDNSGSGTGASASGTVNIGVIYPKTGQYAEYGKMFEQGFDLAVAKVNKDGGVGGRKLGLKYYDTHSDAKPD